MTKFATLIDFIRFLNRRKKYWLIPIVLILLSLGFVLVITQGSVLAPLIYPLF